MKNLQNLKGAKALNKQEQKAINGGGLGIQECCDPANECCTPQPVAFQLIQYGCASPEFGCQFAHADPNCTAPVWTGCI